MQPYDRQVRAWTGTTGMKAIIDLKSPCFQFLESATDYSIWFDEGYTRYYCVIAFSDTADKTAFDADYKSRGNFAVPALFEPFSANTVEFKGDAIVAVSCAIDTMTPLVMTPSATEARLLNGGILHAENAKHGDFMSAEVLDASDVVQSTWIVKWGIIPGFPLDLTTPQAGTIPATYKLRIKYTAVGGGTPRIVTVNYRLNKRL